MLITQCETAGPLVTQHPYGTNIIQLSAVPIADLLRVCCVGETVLVCVPGGRLVPGAAVELARVLHDVRAGWLIIDLRAAAVGRDPFLSKAMNALWRLSQACTARRLGSACRRLQGDSPRDCLGQAEPLSPPAMLGRRIRRDHWKRRRVVTRGAQQQELLFGAMCEGPQRCLKASGMYGTLASFPGALCFSSRPTARFRPARRRRG